MLNLAHVRRGALALSLAATLAAAPAALASGGSSGGGSGGGGGGGGGGSTTTTTSSSSCAKITSFGNISGYAWGSGTEIDTPYTVASSCSGPTTVDVTYTNQLTGVVDFERSVPLAADTTYSGTFIYAPGPYSTPYTVTLSVIDLGFNTLTSQSASVTTKKPKTGTV